MLSVLHILSSLELGGAERVTVELAQVQRHKEIDAQILSLGGEDDFLVQAVRKNNIPLTLSTVGGSRFSRYRQIMKAIRQFDVLHIHSRGAFRFVAPLLPFFNKKIIYTRHGLNPQNTPYQRFAIWLLRPFVAYVTFVTKEGRDVFTDNHSWNPKRLKLISNGVFVPESFSISKKLPIRFGSVGRMITIKGQEILFDAIDALKNENKIQRDGAFILKLYGSGPLEEKLREKASVIGDDLIEFCGEESDVEKIYEDIDVLIVASESEGLSMVIIEAMARGRPAIATDVGGNAHLVKDGETGILIPYGSHESIGEAIMEILNNVEQVEGYGLKARELMQSKYSLSAVHEAYLECYLN